MVGNKTGYMMTQFIDIQGVTPGDDDPIAPDPDQSEMVTLQLTEEECAAAYPLLKALCEQIERKVGAG